MHSWRYPALIQFQRESINFYIKEVLFNPSAKHTVQQNMKFNIWCLLFLLPLRTSTVACTWLLMWVVHFHFCDNWLHVRFLTQLYTNRGICLKYIPGLWYCHSTLSCVTWTSQDLQRWTESLQTYLRQDVGILVAGSIWDWVTISSRFLMACDTQTNTKLAFSTSNSLSLM